MLIRLGLFELGSSEFDLRGEFHQKLRAVVLSRAIEPTDVRSMAPEGISIASPATLRKQWPAVNVHAGKIKLAPQN
jgi:hypothetical protein